VKKNTKMNQFGVFLGRKQHIYPGLSVFPTGSFVAHAHLERHIFRLHPGHAPSDLSRGSELGELGNVCFRNQLNYAELLNFGFQRFPSFGKLMAGCFKMNLKLKAKTVIR